MKPTELTNARAHFVRKLRHRPEKVWRALTEEGELAGWFPAKIEGPRGKGAPLRFVFRNGESRELAGTITEWDPPRVFAYTMGDESLRWELSPIPEGCLLELRTEVGAANDNDSSSVCSVCSVCSVRACANRLAA